MHKDDLKDFLFDILNEHDTIFTDISLDDETDTIFIKSVDGENFIVTVSPVIADEALIELWAKKNPELISLALSVLNMRDLELVSNHQFNWWFALSPNKGFLTARPKGRCRKHSYWSAKKRYFLHLLFVILLPAR